ncbi:gp174 [Bacillus phage G]|uniref:Gp174 n=1 Tax=Bacillus phage G TaxID=2884420 RepID=G3MBP0_9CAUD|nr:gp174 [Bacillus phage G]AEO93434.1 gp174 [Bacillus phage G]
MKRKGSFVIKVSTYKKRFSRITYAQLTNNGSPIQVVCNEEGIITTALSGRITKSRSAYSDGIKNAKITAYKDGKVYDYTYTHNGINEDGEYDARLAGSYSLFLENGKYDIRIESELYNRTIKNYLVEDGIKLYRKTIRMGQIKAKYPLDDVVREGYSINNLVTFVSYSKQENCDYNEALEHTAKEALIVGVIRDQHNLPTEDAELIVADSKTKVIKAFIRTKGDGKFSFVLEPGKYDVILRSTKHSAKIVRDYDFVDFRNGFLLDLFNIDNENYNNSLKSGGEWLWISK